MKNTYLSIVMISALSTISCNEVSSQTDNDLATINAPQNTRELVEKTMIYKYDTDEIKVKSTSTFTFNYEGNFLTHEQVFPDGKKNTQEYTYDDNGKLLKIIDYNSRYNTTSISSYSYEGENPQTILVSVENGQNYVPKIIKYFKDDKLSKEEIYNNDDVLRELTEYDGDERKITSYTNSGEISMKRIKLFDNGNEIKTTNYNPDGTVRGGVEKVLDKHGNMIESWILDENLERKIESFGYHYVYDNDVWMLRTAREIRDYGSGPVANLKVREIKGKKNHSISDAEIKEALKNISKD